MDEEMEKQVANCSESLQEKHEGMMSEIRNEIRESFRQINEKLDGLNVIHVVNGNEDGTPTMYTRDVFFQGQYNASKKVYDLEKKFDEHMEHTPIKKLNTFSSVAKQLQPIIWLIAVIIFLGYSLLTNKSTSDRQDRLERKIEKIVVTP